jgi:hypothetical protein
MEPTAVADADEAVADVSRGQTPGHVP